jgi:hypothetical protein
MRLIVERRSLDPVVERLAGRDPSVGEDARAAVDWLTRGSEEGAPVVFTRRGLQEFLWYELPRKWLIGAQEHLAVADALARLFDELGPEAVALAALCRDPETARLLRTGADGFVEAIHASGLDPPDTALLEWSDLMTIEESLERDAVAEMLEEAVDSGELVPGAKGWQQRQADLVDRHLITPDAAGGTPLARVHAARRDAWLAMTADDDHRNLLETVTPLDSVAPTPAEAEAAVEPLLWLLGRLTDGLKLTQTGALPRVLVREANKRYPDWWDTDLFGPPHREAEVYALEVLHAIVDQLKLARPRHGVLKLSPRGRVLHTDPSALLATIASMIAAVGVPPQLDLALVHAALGRDPVVDIPILRLLRPFRGVAGKTFREPAPVTAGGQTLAAAILNARAFGPRHSFG